MTRFTLLLSRGAAWRSRSLGGSREGGGTRHYVGDQTRGITFGHLTELNGKFKMRATEFTFAQGPTLERITILGPGFDIFFLASSRSLGRRCDDL